MTDGGKAALDVACNYGKTEILKLLYKHLLTTKSAEDVQEIMHYTDDVDDGMTLFHKACQNGKIETVKYLMTIMTIDIDHTDNSGRTPLIHACIHGNTEMVEYLLAQNADVNKQDNRGNTPFLSVLNGFHPNRQIIDLLLNTKKVKLNVSDIYNDESGANLLFGAARYGSLKLAELLLTENVCLYNQSK